MKRLVAAAIIAAAVIILCICGNLFVNNICRETEKMLDECTEAYRDNDYESASEKAEKLRNTWDSKQGKLALFVNHSMLDEITYESTAMPYLASDAADGDFFASSAKISRLLMQIRRDQRISCETFY